MTPADLELTAGERALEVRLAGFNAWHGKLQVVANEPQQLPDVKLAPADGRVEIASTPSEASVSIDGEFRGRTPLQLRLTPGTRARAHADEAGLRDRDARPIGGGRQRPASEARRSRRSTATSKSAARRRSRDLRRRRAQGHDAEHAAADGGRVTTSSSAHGFAPQRVRVDAAAGVSAEARPDAGRARREHGRRLPDRYCIRASDQELQTGSGRPIHDGLVAARAGQALERGVAARACHARVLSRRPRGHERGVPRSSSRSTTRASSAGCR